jgi:concentrative nucleoside transporter, CNT family
MLNNILHCVLSFIAFYGIAFILSENKKKISLYIICKGVVLQIIFTLVLLKVPAISIVIEKSTSLLDSILKSTTMAVSYVFGGLANPPAESNLGYILAFQGFPILIVISGLSSVLTYWRILPAIIKFVAIIYRMLFNIGGTLGTAVSVNLFTGMSETPLIIRSYLKHLTRSELFSLMVCGTSGISSSVIILYALILDKTVAGSITHIINAVLISIPCALTLSRVIIPETSTQITQAQDLEFSTAKSSLEAICNGLIDGAMVMIKIIVMLIGFVALIDIFNHLLQHITPASWHIELTLQKILGWIMLPIAWIIGIPEQEAIYVASLLGSKFILNEIIAFSEMTKVAHLLSDKTKIICVYLLSSFANIGSIGVMIGIYTTLIPERKDEVISLGIKSVVVGSLVSYLTSSLINILI